ncbi:MAG: Rieske 2Fe-2S domain-containing protein [Gemmatimonadota bacterium]|nr:Rieske 2Fe-2S domain-containing protein [Gemmatimonadota bacterium]
MRSKASFRGHPIHPALIPFPFAFLYGAFLFDVAGRIAGRPTWWTVGAHLAVAGIVTALVAAVPGFIDYLYTVPPRSTGKRRATRHMLANLSAVGLFVVAWWLRGSTDAPPDVTQLALEAAGAGLLGAGGWMGGVLVNRNQIGVDHRNAGAGKWREAVVDSQPGRAVPAAKSDELQVNQMKLLRTGDRRIVLARTEQGYVAFDDRCTHRGGSLAGGVLICGTVQCPWHGSQFDARTGEVKSGPAKEGIATYRVEERGGEVWMSLESGVAGS